MYPFGWQELEGVAVRGDFDLRMHAEATGKAMTMPMPVVAHADADADADADANAQQQQQQQQPELVVPQVIEPSVGVGRLVLALLCSAYRQEGTGKNKRTWLALHPRVAPVKAAVLPLVKSDPALVSAAHALHASLVPWVAAEVDTAGSVGRRYRRADEVGTPFCLTVDGATLEDGTVTVRHRDTMEQHRVPAFASQGQCQDEGGSADRQLAAEPTAVLQLLRSAMMSGA